MAYSYEYPYTDPNRSNADWLLNRIKELSKEFDEFVLKNQIKYAEPIQWNIATQYEQYTIVTNENSAYLSKKAVPSGVSINNEDYWLKIADYGELYDNIKHSIAIADDRNSTTSSADRNVNSLVWLNDKLYKVVREIFIGDAYVLGGDNPNIILSTIEDLISILDSRITLNETNIENHRLRIEELEKYHHPIYNVKDYGAIGDGIADDYQAFVDCVNDVPYGANVYIPFGRYNLSANPDGNNIKWIADHGTTFVGAGAGDPTTGAGLFGSTDVSNPWIIVSGTDEKVQLANIVSPRGGGVYANATELDVDLEDSFVDISGTLTNGSADLTNITDFSGIEVGYGIIPVVPIAGFPTGDHVGNTMRVISIDKTNSKVTFGLDMGGGQGAFSPTVFTGTSGNYNFKIRKRTWKGIRYEGLNTSVENNVDNWSWVYNSVVNLHNSPAFQMELDFNIWGTPSEMSRCVSLTGIGNSVAPCTALEIVRGGSCNWTEAILIGNSATGIDVGAAQPIYIRSRYHNNQSGQNELASFGVIVDNVTFSALARPVIAFKQLENNAQGLVIQRINDNDPKGTLIDCTNSTGSEHIFTVYADGNTLIDAITAVNNCRFNANTYIEDLQVGSTYVAEPSITPTGYITIKGRMGATLKIPVAI